MKPPRRPQTGSSLKGANFTATEQALIRALVSAIVRELSASTRKPEAA